MSNSKIIQSLKHIAFLFIGISAVLLTLAMLISYEPTTGYFPSASQLPLLAVIFSVLGAVCGSAWAFTAIPAKIAASPFYRPAALVSFIGFLLCGMLLLLHTQAYLSALFFFFAALYAFLSGTSAVRQSTILLAGFGFLTVIACALGNVYCYFDISLEMNAPVKVFLQTALLFSMIYYTGEVRFLLGREKKRFYLIIAFCALAASFPCAIAFLVAYLQGTLLRTDYLALSVCALGISISLLLRILFYTTPKKESTVTEDDTTTEQALSDSPEIPTLNSENTDSTTNADIEEQKETDEE